MQSLHVAAFWFGLAGNIFLDLFLYVHIKYKIRGCLLCLFKSRSLQFSCVRWFGLAFRVDDSQSLHLIELLDTRGEPSTSCVAAVRVKPKARLCEPWVSDPKVTSPVGATAITGSKRARVHQLSVAASRLA